MQSTAIPVRQRVTLEFAILASLVLECSGFTGARLAAGDFSDAKNRSLFSEMEKLANEGVAWDYAFLAAKLPSLLADRVEEIINAYDKLPQLPISHYRQQLKEMQRVAIAPDIIATSKGEDPYAIAARITAEADKLTMVRPTVMISEVSAEVYKKLERAYENPDSLTGVTSGLRDLDKITWGFQPRRVYIMAGRPSMGKSAVAVNIATNAALAGKRIYIQSLEDSKQGIYTRVLSRLTEISNERLQKGQIREPEWAEITNTMDKQIKNLNILIDDSTGLTSQDIFNRVRQEHMRNPLHLVIVDHLQEIREREQNRHLEISRAASTLRGMAKTLGLPVLILSQLSRSVEQRGEKHPLMSDLKESGDIEAIADMILLLYRPSYYEVNKERPTHDTIQIHIAKNRDGRIGLIDIGFKPQNLTCCDWDYTFYKPQKESR